MMVVPISEYLKIEALILSFLFEQTTHCDQKVVEHEVKLLLSSAFAHGFFQHM
jgi:hypothetical protein